MACDVGWTTELMDAEPFDIDRYCGSTFTYRDFFECSEAWRQHDILNVPQESETFAAIELLCSNVLDRVVNQFGRPTLTYGFCSAPLATKIDRGIAPKLDQHAGFERNGHGKRICHRDGFAADFELPGSSTLTLGQWIVANTEFDRLYYYGADRPIHVSASHAPVGQVVLVSQAAVSGRRIPRAINAREFLDLTDG